MKNLTFLKLFVTTMFVMATALFAGCVDDNDDTEAPRLEVSPKTLVFDTDGTPVEGSQSYFEISANRHWTATVLDDKTWVTLSKMEGDGSDKVQVSIPEGITDEAKVLIQISNKVGVLMKEEVTIRSGNIVPAVVIYNETFGTTAPSKSPYPFVDEFTDWVKSGEGSTTVEYAGSGASIRQSGKLSAGYEGASGGDKLFFGNNANFIIQKITLKSDQTNLKLGFGGSYSQQITGGYDNEFKPESFHFYLSKDGTTWSNAIQYDYKQADEYWVYVTSNFTLKYPVNTLYIKFAADIASVFAIDDPTLSTGNGGQEIDLGNTDPAVSTAEATQVNGTSATLGGSVVNMDVASATEVGVQYTEYTGDVTNIDWANVAKTKAQENGSLTGIAAAYKTSAQLLPRNLEDVKEFEATGPTITSVAPSQVNFPSTGGEETLIISTSNQGSSTLQLSPLGEGISAEVIDNNTVKVKAEANTSTNEIKKDLVISLSGGNSVTVPIKVAAIGGSNGYKLIETVADLSEGKYFMAGYAEISNDKTDLKPYTYQIWQGTLSSSDLVTVAYQYQGDELIAKDASQVAAEMELVKIDGKADTYYIKIGDQYLYNPSKATNRKLKLKDTADESVEWKFEDKNNGGVTASNNEVYLVTANADSKFIRSYKSSSISSLKGIFFFKKK